MFLNQFFLIIKFYSFFSAIEICFSVSKYNFGCKQDHFWFIIYQTHYIDLYYFYFRETQLFWEVIIFSGMLMSFFLISGEYHLPNVKVKTRMHCIQLSKLATIVEGDLRAPFTIATTPRCRGGRYSFPWIAPLYP